MFQNIAYFLIFGKPLIIWGGLATLTFLLLTATVGYIINHGIYDIPIKYHKMLAFTTVGLALFHGILGILVFFF